MDEVEKIEGMKYYAECNNCKTQKLHLTYEQIEEFRKAHANCKKEISNEEEREKVYN